MSAAAPGQATDAARCALSGSAAQDRDEEGLQERGQGWQKALQVQYLHASRGPQAPGGGLVPHLPGRPPGGSALPPVPGPINLVLRAQAGADKSSVRSQAANKVWKGKNDEDKAAYAPP